MATSSTSRKRSGVPRGGTCKRVLEKYPNLLTAVKESTGAHYAVAAHHRRHNDVERIGISKEAIVRHLQGMDIKVSTDYVGRLFHAPNIGHRAASYYENLLDGRF